MTVPVSVVIPAHNSELTIRRTLESVLNQTELPLEIIVVDDCSTDSTTEIVSELTNKPNSLIRLKRLTSNVGPSQARNSGWDEATSEFVAFLDSDDSWHPRKLEIQTKWMLEHPEHPVSGHLTGSSFAYPSDEAWPVRKFNLTDFLVRNRISTPTVMVRTSILERFDSNSWYAEDYDLWLQILSRVKVLARIELPLTQLHKADYGEAGLSSHLLPMFRGEVQAVRNLYKKRHIPKTTLLFAQLWMSIKYLRRLIVTRMRRPK